MMTAPILLPVVCFYSSLPLCSFHFQRERVTECPPGIYMSHSCPRQTPAILYPAPSILYPFSILYLYLPLSLSLTPLGLLNDNLEWYCVEHRRGQDFLSLLMWSRNSRQKVYTRPDVKEGRDMKGQIEKQIAKIHSSFSHKVHLGNSFSKALIKDL